MHYFRRFVEMSTTLRWSSPKHATPWDGASPKEDQGAAHEDHHRHATTRHTHNHHASSNKAVISPQQVLDFVDATSHFVYGGDAFDQGDDITFASTLLDFKKRYPHRVHLILGNRDINKMVFGPLMQTVGQYSPAEAEQRVFSVPYTSSPGSSIDKKSDYVSFPEYMQQHSRKRAKQQPHTHARVDRTLFLRWALKYKLGCKNTFEHRRRELRALQQHASSFASSRLASAAHAAGTRDSLSSHDTNNKEREEEEDDAVVAESFFDAARPGGVYYEYLQHAHIAVLLDGILFVHGGVNYRSLGFVPHVQTPPDWAKSPTHSWGTRASSSKAGAAVAAAAAVTPSALTGYYMFNTQYPPHSDTSQQCAVATQNHHRDSRSSSTRTDSTSPSCNNDMHKTRSLVQGNAHVPSLRYSPHGTNHHHHHRRPACTIAMWVDALNRFAQTSVEDWQHSRGGCGENLRCYAYPRAVVPDSVVVNAPIDMNGPHYASLDVVHRLLSDGVHTVCAGHQPTLDSPAIVRQPGGFLMINADNSYCDHYAGRNRHAASAPASDYHPANGVSGSMNGDDHTREKRNEEEEYDRYNTRGRAVTEIIFTVPQVVEAEETAESSDGAAFAVRVRGRRVDGQPFDFDAAADDLVGRCVGEGWWVKLRLPGGLSARYELQRTRDGFRSEEKRVCSREEVLEALRAVRNEMVEGELANEYTAAELADTPVRRLKTKVTPKL